RWHTIAEIGVHAAKPEPDCVVGFLGSEDLNDAHGVQESRRSLFSRDIMAARPATHGLWIPNSGHRSDQALPEQVLQRTRRGGNRCFVRVRHRLRGYSLAVPFRLKSADAFLLKGGEVGRIAQDVS